jgi:hypothetical protein
LLAVAKGRFPIELTADSTVEAASRSKDESEDSPSHQIIGGAKGYWAMIQAICDGEPPVAGNDFSIKFNHFIDMCLQKAAADRSTAAALLKCPFISDNIQSPRHPASIFKPGNRERDEENLEEFHEFGVNDLLTVSDSPLLSSKLLNPEDEQKIIYAIRLEHLDRLMDRIAEKLDPVKLKEEDISVKESAKFASSVDSSDDLFVPDKKEITQLDSEEKFLDEHPHSILKYGSRNFESGSAFNPKLLSLQEKTANRSVHFQEDRNVDSLPQKNKNSEAKPSNLRSRLNVKLSLNVECENESEEMSVKLPKPSSYFLKTGNENFEDVKEDEKEVEPAIDEKINIMELVNEYKRMIPEFEGFGLDRWRNLAVQLNLPLQIVVLAAKSKLSEYL